jgi:hypothetical protein
MENDILSKVSNVRRKIIETDVEWGLYVYKKADGKYFTDGEGNVLNIPSMKGDLSEVVKLRDALQKEVEYLNRCIENRHNEREAP